MIASLAMYDLPWLQAANDRLWSVIAAHLHDAGIADIPQALSQDRDLDDVWRSPALLLAQSCGYPVMTELRETVQLVATPRYDADGCDGVLHRAAIIVRADAPLTTVADLRGKRVGINDARSNSGMNLLRAAIAPIADGGVFFGGVHITGSHAQSFADVGAGRIDVASVDAVTLAHITQHCPHEAGAIRILAWTAASPVLPFVTASATTPETLAALRGALRAASADPAARESLKTLRITGFEQLGFEDYAPVLDLERLAVSQGYAEIR